MITDIFSMLFRVITTSSHLLCKKKSHLHFLGLSLRYSSTLLSSNLKSFWGPLLWNLIFKELYFLSQKSFESFLGCVLRIILLLKNPPSFLLQILIKKVPVHFSIDPSFDMKLASRMLETTPYREKLLPIVESPEVIQTSLMMCFTVVCSAISSLNIVCALIFLKRYLWI